MIFIRDKAHLVATRATPPAVAEDLESSSARDGEGINRVNSWDGYWLQDMINTIYIIYIYTSMYIDDICIYCFIY